MYPTLHLICGQAGAGKTTFAKSLAVKRNAVRFSKDEYILLLYGRDLSKTEWTEAEDRCCLMLLNLAGELLRRNLNVVLDFGFWYKKQRLEAKELAVSVGAMPLLHFLDVPMEVRRERIQARNSNLDPASVEIDRETFEKQVPWFERPTEDEMKIEILLE